MEGIGVVFREHGIGAGANMRFSGVEVVRISIGIQNRIAGLIDNAVIGIGFHIVKQLQYGFIGHFNRNGLLGKNLCKCHKELVVYGTCIEQEAVKN